jgi:SAM-dependent methyltransferase
MFCASLKDNDIPGFFIQFSPCSTAIFANIPFIATPRLWQTDLSTLAEERTMPEHDPAAYMEKLYQSDPLQDPLMRRIVRSIGLPEGSLGLDAGCGVGLQIPPLAEAVGAQGHVTALDILPQFVQEAGRNIAKWKLDERVSLVLGDIYALPFEEQQFDWIWSASCACYAMRQPLELLQALHRLLKPGGLLLIVIWSGQQLLPGYPRLEAVLNATTPGIAPFTVGDPPTHHFLRPDSCRRGRGPLPRASVLPLTNRSAKPCSP